MVTTKFIGRLGNSMFQIAAAIGYAKKYGYQWGVPNNAGESSILRHFPNLPRCNDNPKRYLEHQPGHDHDWFNYHEIPDVGPDVLLFGFWQSWKYFEHAKEEVRQALALKFENKYHDSGSVALHVRRGDYVQHAGSFPPVTVEYFKKAFDVLKARTDVHYIDVFSDDIKWCRDNLPQAVQGSNSSSVWFFHEGTNEYQDMSAFASCKHHIIANSTFSWWPAYLRHREDGIVISPSHKRGQWFGNSSGVQQDCVDLLPPEWIQIEFR